MSEQWPAHSDQTGPAPDASWRYDGDQTALREWTTTAPHALAEPEGPQGPKQNIAMIAAVVAVIAALLTAGALVFVNRGGSASLADEATYVFMSQAPPPPVFEPRDVEGEGAFFPLDVQLAGFIEDAAGTDSGSGGSGGSDGAMPTDDEIASGLYGGTAEETCDQERLIEHLMNNPAQGEAWAQVQGIEFAELPAYIRSLEARVLAEPTTVLNHGYDGVRQVADQVDTTLDAGTAVLVDANGDVRARCYCGNPVTPKPANHKPPRCLHLAHLVFVAPGGQQRDPMGRDVVITGERAVSDSTAWTEVMFAGDVKAWTPEHNVGPDLCAPSTSTGGDCVGPGTVAVYGSSDGKDAVGSLNGEVRTAFGIRTVGARVQRAGGDRGAVVEQGRALIRYPRSDVANTTSAWVDVGALNAADAGTTDCAPLRVCAEFPDGLRGPDGSAIVAPAGPQWTDFTGAFPAGAGGSMAEVVTDFAAGPMLVGTDAYQPVAEEACRGPEPPRGTCFSRPSGFVVHADAAQTSAPLAEVFSAHVVPLGQVDGDLFQAEIVGTGLTGWFNEAGIDIDGSSCRKLLRCAVTSAPLAPTFPAGGAPVGAISEATLVEVADLYGFNPDEMTEQLWHLDVVGDDRAGWIPMTSVDVTSNDAQQCTDAARGERRCVRTLWNDPAGGEPRMLGSQVVTLTDRADTALVAGPRLAAQSEWYGIDGYIDADEVLPDGDCVTVSRTACLSLTGPAYRSYPFTASVDVPSRITGGLSELRIVDGATHSLVDFDGDQIWARAIEVASSELASDPGECASAGAQPAPSPEPTAPPATPVPTTPAATPTPTATPAPQPTPTVAPRPQPTAAPAPAPTATPLPTVQPTPEPTPQPACSEDADNDGICDDVDDCIDADGDLHCDNADNCVGIWNPGQTDADEDGIGDACDQCPDQANGQGRACPLPCPDNDLDGICDGQEPPTQDPFEPVDLIGMREADAMALAAANGYSSVVVRRDNDYFPITTVFLPDRIQLSVDSGIVTGVRVG